MQDKLIDFKTAKLAKKKGFNIMPDMFFDDIDTLRSTNILKMPGCYPGSVSFVSIYQELDVYYAPTQSLLQAWIRKKHNIHISVNPYNNTNQYSVHVYNIILSEENNLGYDFNETYNSYEEALEQGLLAALKFIKEKYEK